MNKHHQNMRCCNNLVVFISNGELEPKFVHRSKILDMSRTRLDVFDWSKRVWTSLITSASVEFRRYNPVLLEKPRRAQAGRSAHACPPHAPGGHGGEARHYHANLSYG